MLSFIVYLLYSRLHVYRHSSFSVFYIVFCRILTLPFAPALIVRRLGAFGDGRYIRRQGIVGQADNLLYFNGVIDPIITVGQGFVIM